MNPARLFPPFLRTAANLNYPGYTDAMKLVLFDIDGTLIRARGAGKRALERAIHAHYGIEGGLSDIRLDGKTDPQILREALPREQPSSTEDLLSEPFRNLYSTFLQEELKCCHFSVLPGVEVILWELSQDARFCIGIATGNMQEGAELKLRRAGLENFFRFAGYGSDSTDRTGVIRQAILRGEQIVGGAASDVFVIGDPLLDVIHGKRAGARVIAVATGSYGPEELRKSQPDLVIESLEPSHTVIHFMSTSCKT